MGGMESIAKETLLPISEHESRYCSEKIESITRGRAVGKR
jgi:hypothetical protein